MPAKSKAQYRLMQAIAHDTSTKKGIGGLTKSVAREFIKKTPKKKRSLFSKGH